MKNLINVCFNKNFKQYKIINTIYKTKGMKIFFLLTLFGSFLQSCTKDPTGSGCQPAKDIYFRFTDTFATSLVDVYKQGDTLKLKHNSGTIYYFIAQKPDSGFAFEKPVTGGYCDGDNYYLQYYQIELKPTVQTLSSIFVKVYITKESLKYFKIYSNIGFYESFVSDFPLPPSAFYYKDYFINNKMYNNVGRISYAYSGSTINFILYSREYGLIKLTQPNGEYYELQP